MADVRLKRVALVTGAASGIGKATAYALGRAGYATVVSDVDASAGRAVADELMAEEMTASFIACDVSDPAAVRSLIEGSVGAFGRLDVAFNNAGIEGEQAATAECSLDNWERVIGVNLRGVFLCMQQEIRQMLTQGKGGSIINCASVAGLVGISNIPAYVASKHGVVGLTKAAALEVASAGIRVNAVCPGAIATPMLDRFVGGKDEARAAMLANEPVGRVGSADEIADAVLWLAGHGASFTTGQAIAVDGGWTAR
jgi:NAD(P)-dependent dehydrogenase (short-subunit alcohol dehydrogenase family)